MLVFFLLGWLGGIAVAQENVVQIYGGSSALTTAPFTVKDKWEVRWDCPDAIAVTILAADGSVVAGGSGAMKGSLYQPKGGTFTLQIARAGTAGSSAWHAVVVELGETSTDTGAVTYYIPPLTASGAAQPTSQRLPPRPSSPLSRRCHRHRRRTRRRSRPSRPRSRRIRPTPSS